MSDLRTLGYAGAAVVDGVQVPVTSASFSKAYNRSYMEMMDIPPDTSSRSKVLIADGTSLTTASVAFDVTDSPMALFADDRLFQRRYSFSLGIHDGVTGQVLDDCYLTSMTLEGSAGGLISCSIQATSSGNAVAGTVANNFIRDQTYYGYWYSGGVDVRDWSLSMSQTVTPVYTNRVKSEPKVSESWVVGTWTRCNDL